MWVAGISLFLLKGILSISAVEVEKSRERDDESLARRYQEESTEFGNDLESHVHFLAFLNSPCKDYSSV